jgi:hypothetical protein
MAFSRVAALRWRIETGKLVAFQGIVLHRRVASRVLVEQRQRVVRPRPDHRRSMSAKILLFGEAARHKIVDGVNTLAF